MSRPPALWLISRKQSCPSVPCVPIRRCRSCAAATRRNREAAQILRYTLPRRQDRQRPVAASSYTCCARQPQSAFAVVPTAASRSHRRRQHAPLGCKYHPSLGRCLDMYWPLSRRKLPKARSSYVQPNWARASGDVQTPPRVCCCLRRSRFSEGMLAATAAFAASADTVRWRPCPQSPYRRKQGSCGRTQATCRFRAVAQLRAAAPLPASLLSSACPGPARPLPPLQSLTPSGAVGVHAASPA